MHGKYTRYSNLWHLSLKLPSLRGSSPSRLDVFSSHVHTRRSHDLYRHAFGENVAIGIIASRPRDFEPTRWWHTSGSGKYVAIDFKSQPAQIQSEKF
jgi:hypothetical protein